MKNTDKISKYVSYGEIIRSDAARRYNINNEPNAEQLANITTLCIEIYDKVREHFGKPIFISSCFRNPTINKIINGAPTSQHMRGEAIDLDCDLWGGVTNKELFEYIKENLDYDQLIMEGGENGWVHVSYKRDGHNRKQTLKILNP